MIDQSKLRLFCRDCPYKRGKYKCPMEGKDMCPEYSAFKTSLILEDNETASLVPVDVLLKALRAHGYSGELRKSVTVTI